MKAKNATTGEKSVAKNLGWSIDRVRISSAASAAAKEFDDAIARAVRAATKAERERCAKAVVAYRSGVSFEPIRFACDDILAAIRGAKA
jgi:hypothetical protein